MAAMAEDWRQLKNDALRSGNVPNRDVKLPLRLAGTIAMTDAILTSPVVADGDVYTIDAAGVVRCVDADTLSVKWTFATPREETNCSNVSSPVIIGRYLHFGTSSGRYFVLNRADGSKVRELVCRGPIFSSPVASDNRVYFATLGAEVYAVSSEGETIWSWDFVKEVLGFEGDRWDGQAWRDHKDGRVTWRDHFCCSRNLGLVDRTLVIPAGGRTVFLEDLGAKPRLRTVGLIPSFAGKEYAASFGQSIGADGTVYVQWHRRDNAGRVEMMKLRGDNVETDFVPGTQTAINLPGLLSFSSVSIRGDEVFRCRPEMGFGLCRHGLEDQEVLRYDVYPSITSPILLSRHAVVAALDGCIYVVPLNGQEPPWKFRTAWAKPLSASPAVCDGKIFFGCEDGYLYVLGPQGDAALPSEDLQLETIRYRLTGKYADSKYDWYTNYGNLAGTNCNEQGIHPPLKLKWMRRYQGTFKHLPVCGGNRMYTHTAEGQVFAVEQESGRLLWRRYWPGTYLSFTSPIYFVHNGKERLLVPQAGMQQSRMRCLDAATGEQIWEAPFTGSPSWSRQAPPIVTQGLAIYASGSGRYASQGTERAFVMKGDPQASEDGAEVMSWIYTHDNPYYPRDNHPRIWAWNLDDGQLAWEKDFSEYGRGGNDSGLCLLDDSLFYSTFFGYSADQRRRRGLPADANGLTASLDPATGNVRWLTTKYYVTAGCTISASDGRLFLGGYNAPDQQTGDRFVYCLDARDGSPIWKSDPVRSAVNVVTIGSEYLFSNASGHDGHVIDKQTGKILSRFNYGYACTRFTCSGPYVMGANMDMIDLSQDNRLVTTGPCIDSRECVGSTVSNGRIFYTSQASGLQTSLVSGDEARGFTWSWESAAGSDAPNGQP
jgi:outer membrane protein assembly factor BamB